MFRRVLTVALPVIVCFTVIILRLAQLTLVQGDELAQQARQQRLRSLEYYQYSRGDMVDRYDRPLVNIEQPCVVAIPGMLDNSAATAARLAPVLGVDEDELALRLEQGRTRQLAPYVLFVGLDGAQQSELEALAQPGVFVLTLAARYGAPALAAQVVGYVQPVGEDGVYLGVSGLEQQYDALLSSRQDAQIIAEVDAAGRLNSGLTVNAAPDAEYKALQLTLDRDFQQLAEAAFADLGYSGSCVIMDPDNGDILAMASAPTFDPYGWSDADDSAYVNKALCLYPPASTFKCLLLLAALNEGIDLPNASDQQYEAPLPEDETPAEDDAEATDDEVGPFVCTGSFTLDSGHVVHCSGGAAHGELDAERALAVSCNCWFVALGQRLGGPLLRDYAARLGLSELAVIGLDTLDHAATDFLSFSDLSQADIANVSLGEQGVSLSVTQLAALTSTCVNGGFRVWPRLVRGVCDAGGAQIADYASRQPQREIDLAVAESLRLMLTGAVSYGTAGAAASSYVSVGGKTGSSETGAVWFSGFAPARQPEWVVSVCVENGTYGGVEAAAVFRRIVDGIILLEGKV